MSLGPRPLTPFVVGAALATLACAGRGAPPLPGEPTPAPSPEEPREETAVPEEDPLAIDRLWNYDDPAGTEERFLEILPAVEATGDPDLLAQLLSQIARTKGLRGQFEEAHAILDEAEALLTADTVPARVRVLLERGRAFNSSRAPEKAVPLFRDAWEIAECLLALDRAAAAKPHFARAHALLSAYDWLVRDEPERLERLRRLGNE